MSGADRANGAGAKRERLTRLQLLALVLGGLILICCAALRIADPYELRLTRELVFDGFQRLAPRAYQSVPVRVVDIDEMSLAKIGQWPWPRDDLARLVDRLTGLGAAAIAFDMVFPEADRMSPSRLAQQSDLRAMIGPELAESAASRLPDNDRTFAAAIKGKPVVLGFAAIPGSDDRRPPVKAGFSFTGEDPRAALPTFASAASNLPILNEAAKGAGAITLSPLDAQGVVRRIPLLWSDGRRIYPSLVLELLRIAQGETSVLVHSRDSAPYAVTAVRVGQFEIPTTLAGELRVRFGYDNASRYVPAARLLSDEPDEGLRPLIAGHVVLVGTSATGLFDARATPLAEVIPGVSIHAQALEQILAGDRFLTRPDWVDAFEWAWTLILGTLITTVTVLFGPVTALAYGGAMAAATFLGAWGAFKSQGILIDPVFPSTVGLVLYVALISFRYFVSDRERRFVRQAFSHYVAPAYLDQIERDPASLRLGGDERQMTVLFLDIRSFTSLSERLSPTEVVEFLNRFLGRLSEDILAEGGTIDKYIGDSIMAFWNAPITANDHAARSCRAALRIRATLHELNTADAFRFRARADALPDVAIGIGINTGPALVGNIGSEMRFNYSVVGDTVNVAARVESQAKPLMSDLIVSQSVTEAAPDFAYIEAGFLELKGKAQKAPLFILVGDPRTAQSAEFAELRRLHGELLACIEGGEEWGEPLYRCYRLADKGFPMLRDFYGSLSRRVGDFSLRPQGASERYLQAKDEAALPQL